LEFFVLFAFFAANTHRSIERQNASPQYSTMFQVVDRLVDLLQFVTVGNQLIQFQFTVAEPAQKDRKIAIRFAIAAAGAFERAIADK
jgi:hypothetical protein